jgi:MFS family permease
MVKPRPGSYGTLVEALGGVITAFSTDHAMITLGAFVVGLGWCAANVSSTAIVVDSAPAPVRGRAIGVLDSLAAVAGLGSTGVLAMLLMVPPAVLLLVQPGALRKAVPAA